MRRTLAAVAVVLTVGGSPVPALASSADEIGSAAAVDPGHRARAADRALRVAAAVLAGDAPASAPSATIALRDLFAALPDLSRDERREARTHLGRPTQGADDPNGDGYTVPSKRTCARNLCLHWVPATRDAPPSRAWVTRTLEVMKRTWRREVGEMGYRRPLRDGARGGNDKFDVYLKDVGSDGYYGYCAPERTEPGHRWLASGYCVLDNDFARAQFGARPVDSLRVTAAHEFFHAVQFAYDWDEDRWLMEGSATWIEERVADGVNDNRQYLPFGQVALPGYALDTYDPDGSNQYGNWAFFEYLATRFGDGVVRRAWQHAGAYDGAPNRYSTSAVKAALPARPGFTKVFRSYAGANVAPGSYYPEGSAWPRARVSERTTLSAAAPRHTGTLTVNHLAARVVELRPDSSLPERSWAARVWIDGPAPRTSPAAVVMVRKQDGGVVRREIRLGQEGRGRVTFRFDESVAKAMVVLVNASTRSDCWEGQRTYACQGVPRDDDLPFAYGARLFRR